MLYHIIKVPLSLWHSSLGWHLRCKIIPAPQNPEKVHKNYVWWSACLYLDKFRTCVWVREHGNQILNTDFYKKIKLPIWNLAKKLKLIITICLLVTVLWKHLQISKPNISLSCQLPIPFNHFFIYKSSVNWPKMSKLQIYIMLN